MCSSINEETKEVGTSKTKKVEKLKSLEGKWGEGVSNTIFVSDTCGEKQTSRV